jgi:hypothetical protein
MPHIEDPLPRWATITRPRVLGQRAGDEFVGQAVEAVALDAFGRQRARDGEGLGDRRVGAVEGGIEAGHLTDIGQQAGDGLDAVEVVRLMQRGEGDEALEFLDDFAVDRDRRRKKLAAMDNAMADGRQIPAVLRFAQPFQQEIQAGLMLRFLAASEFEGNFVFARLIPGNQPGLGADAVDLAGNACPGAQAAIQFEQRELDRGRTGVDGEDAMCHSGLSFGSVGVGDEGGDYAGRDAGLCRVGAAGQDDRHAGAKDNAGGQRVGEIFELLGDHVAGFEIGNDEDFGMAGDCRLDALGLGGDDRHRIVEGERAVEDAALDLAAIGHLA